MRYQDMTNAELTALIRSVAAELVRVGTLKPGEDWDGEIDPGPIRAAIAPLVDAGISGEGQYRGAAAEESTRNALLWYAGEIVSIVEEGHWHVVNSWLNCVDKFAPVMSP